MAEREGFNESGEADLGEGAGEGEFIAPASTDGDAATEARAREVGWVPQEEFRGDTAKWKSAEEFLDYADHVTPVLRKNNQKLYADLRARDDKINGLMEQVEVQARTLKALTEAAEEEGTTRTEERLSDLRSKLVDANREGDHELAAAIQEDLLDLKIKMREQKETPTDEPPRRQRQTVPDADQEVFNEWKGQNPWFKDVALAAAANAIGAAIVSEALENGETPLKGRELLDEVTKRVDNKFNISRRSNGDKVDGGTGNSGTGVTGKTAKRYASLPEAAKQQCEVQAKKFVGPGKKYAKLADWQARFTELYNS